MKCRTGIFIKRNSVQNRRMAATSRRSASCCIAAALHAPQPSSNGWSEPACAPEYSSATPTSSLSGNIPSAVTNWSAMPPPTAWKPLMMNMITPLGWPLSVSWKPLLPPARLFLSSSGPLRQPSEHSRPLSLPRWPLSVHHWLQSVLHRSLGIRLWSLSIWLRSLSLSKRLVSWFDKPPQSSNRTNL